MKTGMAVETPDCHMLTRREEFRVAGKETIYRVVGVQADGTRVILAEHLTEARAQAVRQALLDPKAFREICVEPEKRSS